MSDELKSSTSSWFNCLATKLKQPWSLTLVCDTGMKVLFEIFVELVTFEINKLIQYSLIKYGTLGTTHPIRYLRWCNNSANFVGLHNSGLSTQSHQICWWRIFLTALILSKCLIHYFKSLIWFIFTKLMTDLWQITFISKFLLYLRALRCYKVLN